MWASLACLNHFVNSLVWAGNTLNSAPAWCEISIRITMAASVGLPSSSFCINRCLYNIANIRTISVSKAEKRRSVVIDSLICGLFLSYIPHYNTSFMATATIFSRTLGAIPTSTTPSPPTSSRASGPSSLGLSLPFTASSLRCFTRCRTEFAQFLSSNTPITASRYFRLMALATTELCCTMPLALFTIYLNAVVRTAPFCALVFFVFFGFAVEARKNYRTAFWALWDRSGRGCRARGASQTAWRWARQVAVAVEAVRFTV
ncbi:pheromone receptor [Mycena rebaudengoi]|nr:pheromone receptor [Mycena rebaudengoi]